MIDWGTLGTRLRELPGMSLLLPALEGLVPAHLVGGAVRDLLRGEGSADLDLCTEHDAHELARALAERLDGRATEHQRFGTATVRAGDLEVDVARTRRERYPRPGALPEVEPAPLAEDLGRRDFTVNAMALGLSGSELGRLYDPLGGREDLRAGVVRVLHEGSFVDDPTRLLRAVRYQVRLGAHMDAETERLAREAVARRALDTVSGPRVRDELLDLLAEVDVADGVAALAELGLDRALHPALEADPALAAGAALGALDTGADRVLAVLGALVSRSPEELEPWIESLGLRAAVRDRVMRAARSGPALRADLAVERSPSQLHELLRGEPAEALAVALALGAPGPPVLRYVADLRQVRLEVTGAELVDAGVPESPALGRALEETLRRKLDGEVSGHEEELRLALELAGGAQR